MVSNFPSFPLYCTRAESGVWDKECKEIMINFQIVVKICQG